MEERILPKGKENVYSRGRCLLFVTWEVWRGCCEVPEGVDLVTGK